MVERQSEELRVAGSTPAMATIFHFRSLDVSVEHVTLSR